MRKVKRFIILLIALLCTLSCLRFNMIPTAAAAAWDSLSCASFIENTEHRTYIDMMMRYYISANTDLQSALNNGKSVIFMFEGGSDNYPSNGYSADGGNIRNQAVTIVVKKSSSNYEIVFYCENCSSIPGQPEDIGDYDRQTIIFDGIYGVQTCNHHGKYGALNIITTRGYYTPPSNKDGLEHYADGINIHTRSTNSAGYGYGAWSWGCQLIGTGAGSDNVFNDFMKVVTGIDYSVWIDYYGENFRPVSEGVDVGYCVVDRQLALSGLTSIYTQTALNNITVASRIAYQDAQNNLCAHENYTGCGICSCGYVFDWESTFDSSTMGTYKVLKDFTPRTDMPYDDATKAAVKMTVGDTVEVLGSYRNAYYKDTNHFWYKFRYNDGEIGYVYDTYLQFSGYAPMQVSCSNFSPADQAVLEKKAQPVSGLVESVYPLKAVHAHLDGSWIGTWRASDESTKTVELRQTEINTNLAFETLSDGKHTISLFAEDIFHADSVKFMETVFYINTKDDGCSHSYTSSVTKEPSCTESGVRTYICGNCSDRYTESIPETGHSWADATCTTPKTCFNCGSTEGAAAGHSWTDATCSTPKKCPSCGNTEGSALGHDWLEATCDSPKSCDRCGETDGAALGHQWEDSIDDQYCPVCGQFENPSNHSICSNHALTAINGCPACTMDGSLHICENNFPDFTFRGYVAEKFDSNSDGYLDEMELDRCWNVTLVDQDNVLSVQGIEFFSVMESLTTPGDGKITSIDVRWNSLLNTLVCGEERLTYLDISHNPQLQTLQCSLNSLEELDVSHNPRLLNLTCEGNLLTMIDIINNPLLQSLNCSKNSLTTLDVSCNTKLRHLRCKETGLTALDVSNNPELVELWCSNNEIPSLDLSNAPNLIDLECRENTIAVLNLGNCTNLVLDSYSITPQIISTQISAIPVDEGFAVDMAEIVGPQHIDNIVDVEDADYDTSAGIAIFEEYPLNLAYRYDTGSNDARFGKMTVVVSLKECVHQWKVISCSEPRQCSICKIHDDTIVGHDWTQQIQNEEHIKESAANCRSYNVYWYDCSRCDTISDTEYYTGTKTGDHVFTQKIEDDAHWISGDCQNYNQYFYDCTHCDEIGSETFVSTTKGNHSMSQEWSTSEEKHYHKCTISGCTYISDEGDHIPGDPATETNDQTCTVCDFVITPALVHVHKTTIVPGYVATCTTAGQKTYYTCTCGKWFSDTAASSEISNKADVVIPALGHDWLPATTTKPKTCQRTGCNATEGTVREPYQIISGANSSWKYLNGNLTIASDGTFSEFVGVKLDGKWVDNKYYTVKEGSTYVTLKKTYLRTLDDGTYRVTLVFDHDEVSTNLTIATNFDWTNPFTGDTSGIVMWCIILGGSFGLLTYITVQFIRKKKSRKNH